MTPFSHSHFGSKSKYNYFLFYAHKNCTIKIDFRPQLSLGLDYFKILKKLTYNAFTNIFYLLFLNSIHS